MDATVEAGDMLYFPKGTIHQVSNQPCETLCMTIMVAYKLVKHKFFIFQYAITFNAATNNFRLIYQPCDWERFEDCIL